MTSQQGRRSRLMMTAAAGILLFLTIPVIPSASAAAARSGGFLRDGLQNRYDFEDEFKFDGEMDAEMRTLLTLDWTLSPLELTPREISEKLNGDKEMAHHVHSFLGRSPVRMKLFERKMTRGDLEGFRAVGSIRPPFARSKRNLRAFWMKNNGFARLSTASLLEDSYEESLAKLYPNSIEIEMILPPLKKYRGKKGGAKKKLPSVIYSFIVGGGNVNPSSVVAKARGRVKVYPEGRKVVSEDVSVGARAAKRGQQEDFDDGGVEIGLAQAHLPHGKGLIDPSWAKGRKFFWKGRPVGQL